MKLFQIIEATRSRLIEAGYSISKFGSVERGDGTEVVVGLDPKEGDKTVSVKPLHSKQAHLLVVTLRQYNQEEDYNQVGCDLIRALQQAVYKGPHPDSRDDLDGTATGIQPTSAIFGLDEDDGVVVAHLKFIVHYTE